MLNGERRYQIESPDKLLVERLPDGSIAIFDQATQSVHSLNATSAVTFDVCQTPVTIGEIRAAIGKQTGVPVGEETAEYAVSELQRAGLISGPAIDRRAVLTGIATTLIPVVLTMTAAEQRAYAQASGSGTTTGVPVTTDVPVTESVGRPGPPPKKAMSLGRGK